MDDYINVLLSKVTGIRLLKPSDLKDKTFKEYHDRILKYPEEERLPVWFKDYQNLIRAMLPTYVKPTFFEGFYRGYFIIVKLENELMQEKHTLFKAFDYYSEFDKIDSCKVTTHQTSHKGVMTIRPRLNLTGDDVLENGLNIGDVAELCIRRSTKFIPGVIIFKRRED